jgi:hypothetical protein
MQNFWMAFAKDGVADIIAKGWPEYAAGNFGVMKFGKGNVLTNVISSAEVDVGCAA